jgi:Mrp family chromosome partitioning ATPase
VISAGRDISSVTTPFSHDDLATGYASIAAKLDRLLREQECLLVAGVSRHRHVVGTAVTIGRALVRIGQRRVLVVDGHLRDPSHRQVCGLGDAPGMFDILAGRATVANTIRWTQDRFGFLPAGRFDGGVTAPEHGGYVEGAAADLMPALVEQAGTVFFVAPPLADSIVIQLMGAHATSALLMVHAGDGAAEVAACIAAFADIGVPIRGSVLIRRGRGP